MLKLEREICCWLLERQLQPEQLTWQLQTWPGDLCVQPGGPCEVWTVEAEQHPGDPLWPGTGGTGWQGEDCGLPGEGRVCRRGRGCRVKPVETCLAVTPLSLMLSLA